MTAPPRPTHYSTAHLARTNLPATGLSSPNLPTPDLPATNLPAGTPATETTEQRFTLSATQVTASMVAAVTAALVGSRLGVAGTVIGAGLASVISVVGGAVIGHSILLTRKQVKRAVLQVRSTGTAPGRPAAGTAVLPHHPSADRTMVIPADDYTVVIPAVTRFDLDRAGRDARTGPGQA